MKRRLLNTDERKLWHRATRDVRKFNPGSEEEAQAGVFTSHEKQAHPVTERLTKQSSHSAFLDAQRAHSQHVLEAGDPKMVRHVRRGKREIDATLDLHGLTQDHAYNALQQFLMTAKARRHRILLVITGKGLSASKSIDRPYTESRGILRQRFLQWMEGPFRNHVISIKPSHQKHGGTGAFYVFMKKSD